MLTRLEPGEFGRAISYGFGSLVTHGDVVTKGNKRCSTVTCATKELCDAIYKAYQECEQKNRRFPISISMAKSQNGTTIDLESFVNADSNQITLDLEEIYTRVLSCRSQWDDSSLSHESQTNSFQAYKAKYHNEINKSELDDSSILPARSID